MADIERNEFYEGLDRDKFADWMLNAQRPDGSSNTTGDYIDDEVAKEIWDMAVEQAKAAPGVQEYGVTVLAAWWASGAVQGYILAKLEEEVVDNEQAR